MASDFEGSWLVEGWGGMGPAPVFAYNLVVHSDGSITSAADPVLGAIQGSVGGPVSLATGWFLSDATSAKIIQTYLCTNVSKSEISGTCLQFTVAPAPDATGAESLSFTMRKL